MLIVLFVRYIWYPPSPDEVARILNVTGEIEECSIRSLDIVKLVKLTGPELVV